MRAPLSSSGVTLQGAPATGCRLGSRVEFDNVTVCFDGRQELTALEDLSLVAGAGEFLGIVGPTGCGKSTILNLAAGFLPPTHGRVMVDGMPVEGPSSKRGMVFQQHALFPWTTVRGNVEFGPLACGASPTTASAIAEGLLERVGLRDFAAFYPSALSGGMQQRVGLARALANDPPLLLMDEPFGSLDAQTRAGMQELLLDVWSGTSKTVIFVTHDVEEALFLADRVVVLTARPGRLKTQVLVPWPRPRHYECVTSQEFGRARAELLTELRAEIQRSWDASDLHLARRASVHPRHSPKPR